MHPTLYWLMLSTYESTHLNLSENIFIIRTFTILDPERHSMPLQSSQMGEKEVKRVVCWKSHLPPTFSGHCDGGQEWKHARVKADTYLLICWRGFIHLLQNEGIDFVILFFFSTLWKWTYFFTLLLGLFSSCHFALFHIIFQCTFISNPDKKLSD